MSRVLDVFELAADDPDLLPLCTECVRGIGGAFAGPDAAWRTAMPGERCGAAHCAGRAAGVARRCERRLRRALRAVEDAFGSYRGAFLRRAPRRELRRLRAQYRRLEETVIAVRGLLAEARR